MKNREQEIPPEFFQTAWIDADHPMAAVGLDNTFLLVNHAWERMLGYSSSELRNTTWMTYTRADHIGGDMKSVQDVIDGVIDSYRLEKMYIHKAGHEIPIVLIVSRYPRSGHVPLVMFSVQASVVTATRSEIQNMKDSAMIAIAELKQQVEQYEKGVQVNVGDKVGGDKVGNDKTTNSDAMMKYLMGGFVVMAIVMSWLMYYVVTGNNNIQNIEPPNISKDIGDD